MSVVVEVSARKFMVPPQCACCGADAQVQIAAAHTRTTGVRVIREHTRSLMFPYCEVCDQHIKRWNSALWFAKLFFWLGTGLGLAVAVAVGGGTASAAVCMAVGVVLAIAAYFKMQRQARAMLRESCGSPSAAVSHLGWSGSVSVFAFHSDRYAVSFATANAQKLINVSMRLQSLLETSSAERRPKLESPRPMAIRSPAAAPPTRAQPDPKMTNSNVQGSAVLDWIARIESYKGAEARRNALIRALEEISEPRDRRQLQLAASRIETAAILEKVDGLATDAAKRRHLDRAIAALRSDSVPDELQADQVRALEERLRMLS